MTTSYEPGTPYAAARDPTPLLVAEIGKRDEKIAALEARLARLEAPVSAEEVKAFRHVYYLHSGSVSETYKAALTAFLAGRKGP